MSVINQMLQDLDQRQSRQAEGVDILLSPSRPLNRRRLLRLSTLILLLGAVAITLWQTGSLERLSEAMATIPTAPTAPTAPQPQLPPQTATATAVATPPPPAPAPISVSITPKVAQAVTLPPTTPPAPPPLPLINAITPNPAPAQLGKVPLLIRGQNLADVTAIEVCWPKRCQTFTEGQFTLVDAKTIHLKLKMGYGPEQWTFQLTAASGRSNRFQLPLLAPPIVETESASAPPPSPPPMKQPLPPTAAELAQAAYQRGETAYHNRDIENATAAWREALEHWPHHHPSREAWLRALLFDQKQPQQAEEVLQQGIELAPHHSPYRLQLARLYHQQEQSDKAMALLQAGLVTTPQQPEYHAMLATLQQQQGNHSPALEHFTQAVAIDPEQSRWWLGLALSAEALQQQATALEGYQNALLNRDRQLNASMVAFIRGKLAQLSPQ
ncbi:tetratricopeptide repeat protein [Ectothiorhodospiraceae bacterium BW-2]|nr:tetratricopeptide repeat protein [Ectothiorhodospiraceae bacterium BW-2]